MELALADVFEEYHFRGLTIETCTYLRDSLPQEADAIAQKRGRLATGEFQPGDFPINIDCALAVGGAGLLLFGVEATGGAMIALLPNVAGSLMGLAVAWRGPCGQPGAGFLTRLNPF